MRRREFISLLIDAAARPLVAHAQQLRKLPPNASNEMAIKRVEFGLQLLTAVPIFRCRICLSNLALHLERLAPCCAPPIGR